LAIGLPASRRRLIGSTALTGCGVAGSAHPQAATVVASTDVWRSVARGIVLSLAPGVPVSVFVATISFLIYLFC
jgi:zinc/manganese transport system permease protein